MRRAIILSSALIIILSGCNLPSGTTPTPVQRTATSPPATHTVPATEKPTPTESVPSTETPIPTSPPPTTTPTKTAPGTSESSPLPALTKGDEVTITHMTMITTSKGWAVGHQGSGHDHILYTEDGGRTWMDRTPPTTKSQDADQTIMADGFFLDENQGWVKFYMEAPPPPLGPQFVWRTTNAGKTWQISQPLPLIGQEFYFIPTGFTFLDADQGWLLVHVDSGMSKNYSNLYATNDGGDTWERVVDPMGSGLKVGENTGMSFANENLGWVTKDATVVAKGPFIEKTTDGGYTWKTLFLPSPSNLDFESKDIYCKTDEPTFTSSQTRLLLLSCQHTDKEEPYQYVYATTDSGESWRNTPLPSEVFELEFVDFETGYALGKDIYKTVNGGEDWQKVKTVFWEGDFTFVNEDNGWAVARKGENIALVHTRDGALTWEMLDPVIAP